MREIGAILCRDDELLALSKATADCLLCHEPVMGIVRMAETKVVPACKKKWDIFCGSCSHRCG